MQRTFHSMQSKLESKARFWRSFEIQSKQGPDKSKKNGIPKYRNNQKWPTEISPNEKVGVLSKQISEFSKSFSEEFSLRRRERCSVRGRERPGQRGGDCRLVSTNCFQCSADWFLQLFLESCWLPTMSDWNFVFSWSSWCSFRVHIRKAAFKE